VAYHFASNGQPIPEFVLRKKNIDIQTAVYKALPNATGEVETNRETIRSLINRELNSIENIDKNSFDAQRNMEDMIDEYAESFQKLAQLGFVSMDMDEMGVMHVIAKPKGQIVPKEIFEKLPVAKEEEVVLQMLDS
jgi:hypothetical protein